MLEQIRQIGRQWSLMSIIVRVAAFTGIWLVLAQGDIRYWGLVAVAVLTSTFASLLLVPSSGLGTSFAGWARFILFFLIHSVLGGFDVARRAFTRPPRVDPVYVEYRFRLAEEPARVLVANVMSLMPGTLSVSIEGNRLRMHVLDRSMPAVERAGEVEDHAARMFRLQLPE